MAEDKMEIADQEGTTEEWDVVLKEIDDHGVRMRKCDKRGVRIESLYRGEGDTVNADSDRFKILWTVTDMQRPLIYDTDPKPVCRRRWLEKDEPARLGAEIMERAISYFQECEGHEFDDAMKRVRDDFLVVGRGTARIVYDADFEDNPQKIYISQEEADELDEDTEILRDDIGLYRMSGAGDEAHEEKKTYEEVYLEHVYWRDFAHSDGRDWEKEVWWVGFASWLTREDLVEQFGEEIGSEVPLMKDQFQDEDHKKRYSTGDIEAYRECARVWEFWNKRTRKVYKVAENYKGWLEDPIDDPYGLEGFFPCPRPVYMIEQTSCLEFVPEYKMYEYQAQELNDITGRIDRLTNSLSVRGVYDSKLKDAFANLVGSQETKLFPCENMSQVMQYGKDGAIFWMPLAQTSDVLAKLLVQRDNNLKIIYEVVGLADVVRGTTNAREAGKTQEMKMNVTTGKKSRIGVKQGKMEKFSRNCVRLMAEAIAELFSEETLAAVTQMPRNQFTMEGVDPQAQEGVTQVMRILRNDSIRGFRIDVETGSTVAPDEAREKSEMFEFFKAFAELMAASQGAVESGALDPQSAKELVLWAARRFRAGGDLEDILERAAQQPPKDPGQDPAAQIKQQELMLKQEKLKLDQAELQADLQMKQADLQIKIAELQQRGQVEEAKLLQKDREAMINQRTALINATGGNIKK